MAENTTPIERDQYRLAIVELMAQGARGAVMVNMVMPRNLPPLARIPASVIAASGFAGVQAFRSLWDGAMGRPLVQPRYRGPWEEVVSTAAISSAVGASGSLAIGRTVPTALRMGGRIGGAVFAGEAAAEAVRQFADAAHEGALGERAREWFGAMQASGSAYFGSAAQTAAGAMQAARVRVKDLAGTAATSVGAAAELARNAPGAAQDALRSVGESLQGLRERILGPAPEPPAPRERPLVPPRFGGNAVESVVRAALQRRRGYIDRVGPQAAPSRLPSVGSAVRRTRVSDVDVEGFWRTRRIPRASRVSREYVRRHQRNLA